MENKQTPINHKDQSAENVVKRLYELIEMEKQKIEQEESRSMIDKLFESTHLKEIEIESCDLNYL